MGEKLDELRNQILQCSQCPLREEASAPVPGLWIPNSEFFFIGEAPGAREDIAGVPFIGQAGRKLNQLLEMAGIDINQCSLDNVVKCRPPKNRDPRKKEIRTCVHWLWEAIRLVKPKRLVTLGRIPLSLFCPYGIKQMHGTCMTVEVPKGE